MNEAELSGLEYGVVLWILVFLALWWTVGLFLWRRYWPRIVRGWRKRQRHRSHRVGGDRRDPHDDQRSESSLDEPASQLHG